MDGRRGGERGGDPENPSLEGSVSQEAFLSSQAVLYARVSSKEQEREG
jgi:hypothetical protein